MKSDLRLFVILMSVAILFAAVALAWIVRAIASESHVAESSVGAAGPAKEPATVYGFDVQTIDGELMRLERFKGKALLIVNTASRCGFTPQYDALEKLYNTYLTTESGQNGEIGWNFTKFLVAPDGRVTARFGSRQDPMSSDVVGAVEEALLKIKS